MSIYGKYDERDEVQTTDVGDKLPDLIWKCPACSGEGEGWFGDDNRWMRCEACEGQGSRVTPAGQQVIELLKELNLKDFL